MATNTNSNWISIRSVLQQHYEIDIINTFINYCNEEQYDLTNIFEDISDISDSWNI